MRRSAPRHSPVSLETTHGRWRRAVFLAPGAKVGISCEVKTSVMLEGSAVAHFNFIDDSIIGQDVNTEAGAIIANHYNEHEDLKPKTIVRRLQLIEQDPQRGLPLRKTIK